MGILDFFRPAGVLADPPPQPTRRQDIPRKRRIEAGEVTRLNASWTVANLPADEEVRRSLDRTRARSRDLAHNNEYARKFLQMVGANIVGPIGFKLQSLAMMDGGSQPDRLARDAIENAWWQWGLPGTCEASGRHGFQDLCRLVVETVARDGEALILRRRVAANRFGYELKLIEIDRLPVEKNEAMKDGNQIVMGVELNPDGRAVAYWVNLGAIPQGGGQSVKLTRIEAADILHIYRPSRAEQHRGLPWMSPVMSGLKMLSGYEEAAIVAARVGAAKMGFYTSPDGDPAALADAKESGEFYQDAEAGAFSVLPPGYDFKAWEPDYPHQGYKDFVQARLRSIASGLGIAYHTLANDLSDVNYSSARAGTLEERDNWVVTQNWFISSFLRPIFLDWVDSAIRRGAILTPSGKPLPDAKLAKWVEHEWQGRRWSWVDPLKDIEAARLAIKTGITSPQMVAAQNGVDVDDVLQDIARFQARVEELGAGLIDYDLSSANEPAPPPDTGISDMAKALLARSLEPQAPPVMPGVHVNVAPAAVTFNQAEVRVDVLPPDVRVEPAVIHNEITVEPTPIEIHQAEVRNIITVEPTPVEIRAEIDLPPPEVTVNLPSRRTATTIERDANGNIVRADQIETDAD